MSLHYILDGYNVIKQGLPQSNLPLKAAREKLFEFIKNYNPQGSGKNKLTIVFDGKEGDFLPENKPSLPEVIFTKNESADEQIKKIVEGAKNPKAIVVVSDDKDIMFFVRRLGAKPMRVAEFLTLKKKTKSQASDDAKRIPASTEFNITEELKKIWLK